MIDEKHALQVVVFVEDDAGKKAVTLDEVGVALDVLEFHFDVGVADDFAANAGEGEAAFFVGGLGLLGGDLRVHDDERHDEIERRGLAIELVKEIHWSVAELHIHDEDLLGHVDLLRGQADAFLVIHGVEHVARELFQLIVKLGDGGSLFTEDRFAKLCYS